MVSHKYAILMICHWCRFFFSCIYEKYQSFLLYDGLKPFLRSKTKNYRGFFFFHVTHLSEDESFVRQKSPCAKKESRIFVNSRLWIVCIVVRLGTLHESLILGHRVSYTNSSFSVAFPSFKLSLCSLHVCLRRMSSAFIKVISFSFWELWTCYLII